jgi:peptide/nickel transport system substrate-binding protein
MRRLSAFCALLLVLSGCSRVTTTASGSRHPWTVPHVLRFADIAEPDHLNPYLSQMDISYALTSLMYSYLIVSDDRGRLIGDLATEVPSLANGGISPDGRTYVYHLRHGVKWHDGQPFTARDVVASWEAVVDRHNLTIYRQGYDRVRSIDTPDDYTVVVHLRERYPPFLTQFFAPLQEGAKPILPAHVLARDADFNRSSLETHPVGTGPFKFVSWIHGEGITLVRNDAYFRGKPKLEKIEFRVVPDGQTELTQMQTHQLDLVYAPVQSLYPLYEKLRDVVVRTVPWNQQALIVVDGGKPGLADENVRRAIDMAIDRKTILQKLLHGIYVPARDTVAPTAIGYTARSPKMQNLGAANRLLDAGGWRRGSDGVRSKGGVRLKFTYDFYSGSQLWQAVGVLLQQNLRAVGIALTIKAIPYNQLFDFDGPIDAYSYDLAGYGSALNWDPDTHAYYGCDQWFPKGQNFYRFCNRNYDRLEALGLTSDDPKVRAPYYRAADKILWDTSAYLPLADSRRLVVVSPDLRHYRPNPTSTPWWNAWQWDI